MGMSLTVHVGYGINIPIGEDGLDEEVAKKVFDFLGSDPKYIQDQDEDPEYGYVSYDDYEMLYDLDKKFSLLEFESGSSGDYFTGMAVFVNRLSATGYYEVATLNADNLYLTLDEEAQLKESASIFGLEYNLEIIAIPSYG